MTCQQIETILLQDLTKRGFLAVARFKRHWFFETDVLAVSKAMITTEFEIKISRADFLRDAGKEGKHLFLSGEKPPRKGIPQRFFYAVPAGLISIDEIPEYAGLVYITPDGKLNVIRQAARIHSEKPEPKLIWDIATLACERAAFEGITAYTTKARIHNHQTTKR